MEVDGEDDSKILQLNLGDKSVFGRGSGFDTDDRTVSRHHVVLELKNPLHKRESKTEPRVSFEVIGQNPVWVCSKKDGKIRGFRKSNKGELEVGDRFCLSGKTAIWFNLKKGEGDLEAEERLRQAANEVGECLHNGIDLEDVDVSGIDPVKEFGFVVMGHEFEQHRKRMICSAKDWDWFLEEPKKKSYSEEEYVKKERNVKVKRRKGKDNEDEEWTGESEEDKEVVGKKIRKSQVPEYRTRSKDSKRVTKARGSGNPKQEKVTTPKVDDEGDGVEDDETLDGFIVDDDEEEDNPELDEDDDDEFEEDEDDEMEG